MIKFSEFFERALQELHEKHDFAAPGTYLMANLRLIDPILEAYKEGVKEGEMDLRHTRGVFCRVDWDTHVMNAAQKVREADEQA